VPDPKLPPLPQRLLSCTAADGELVPAWLGDRDRPWLRDLLDNAAGGDGKPFSVLRRRLLSSEPDPRAGTRFPMARFVLLAWLARRTAPDPRHRERRADLFAAATRLPRAAALAETAARWCCTVGELEADLFADLPGERIVRWPMPPPDPGSLALRTNRALVQGMLRSAEQASLSLHGASRALLRTAWLHMIGCTIAKTTADGVTLWWRRPGGPAGHRSARGLGALCGLLPWSRRYELRSRCLVAGLRGDLVLCTGDPLPPGPEPRQFDSALERDFARDFARVAPDWLLIREPLPLQLGTTLAFPDFELRHLAGGRRYLLEIAGLRDPGALAAKLALLALADDVLLCLPTRFVPEALRDHPRLVAMQRRVPAAEVLRRLQLLGG